MSKGTRNGPAARKNKGDTRRPAEFMAQDFGDFTPQRRKRTLRESFPEYADAHFYVVGLKAGRKYVGGPEEEWEIRKNKHGYGVYLREKIK